MSALLPHARVAMIPEDRLYWARLDAAVTQGLRSKARAQALRYALEPELPVAIEEVAAVFARDADKSIIACACPRDELERLASSADMAVPASVPGWLKTETPASALDLLRDSAPSARARSASLMRTAALLAVCAAISALLTLGMLRRAHTSEQEHLDLQSAIASAQGLVLPPAGPNAQPASIRLAAELRAVFSTGPRSIEAGLDPATDTLRDILARWPAEARLKRLSIGKRDTRIDLSLPADADPAPLLADLESVHGWALSAPVIRPSPAETSVSIGLQRKETKP